MAFIRNKIVPTSIVYEVYILLHSLSINLYNFLTLFQISSAMSLTSRIPSYMDWRTRSSTVRSPIFLESNFPANCGPQIFSLKIKKNNVKICSNKSQIRLGLFLFSDVDYWIEFINKLVQKAEVVKFESS